MNYAEHGFTYNPDTGIVRRHGEAVRWSDSGHGHMLTKINGKSHYAHRIGWQLAHGELPHCIDHINGDPTDNRLCNLRAATHAENMRNSRCHVDAVIPHKGISIKRGNRYEARIMYNRKVTRRTFPLTATGLDSAIAWLTKLRAELHGDFARQ